MTGEAYLDAYAIGVERATIGQDAHAVGIAAVVDAARRSEQARIVAWLRTLAADGVLWRPMDIADLLKLEWK